ncbi:hypothetical protein N7495_008094 [Penicillium taxi]|uniref:uncharacterized protein n=1 Tax=Penicillium taxi TaxID=168475 RepID=UPI0025456336|nr:uncharacterized protein N7495_008094 [Penicillium taxi]KAJ5888053.1 hypothetical protein N7495_008094 [Penicillium taxi]
MRSTAEEMERLQLSDEDTEDLWNSPSKRTTHKKITNRPTDESPAPEPRQSDDDGDTLFARQEAREDALHQELQTVRKINEVIEGLLSSIDSAKGNMETVSQTVTSASTLLNTWTRILSQTEHNQRLILNPEWKGATQDVADMEQETIQKQQAAERREQAIRQQREAAARKAEEEERRRAVSTRGTRGSSRGTVRSTGLGRTPSDQSPETERAFSPPYPDIHVRSPNFRSPRVSTDLPSPSNFISRANTTNTGFGRDIEGGHLSFGTFETSLPIRMDVEAMLAYLLLPPAGGVLLLLFEHKSDYVRFHAWQSSMLFTVIFVLHLILCWSSLLSWTLFLVDLLLIGFLAMRAYKDVDTLDHFEVPYIGNLANSFVDNE